MVERQFGAAGDRILVEEFLQGREVSFIVITDGAQVLPLVTTMDHKAVFDGDEGPNTGGMGTISPSPFVGPVLNEEILRAIILPTIEGMTEEGRTYKGALYAGLMLTEDGPKVLEYNCRFGDPETQPQMLRLKSDLVDILLAAVDGDVRRRALDWTEQSVGLRHPGFGRISRSITKKEKTITGLEDAARPPGVVLFHAGTKSEKGRYKTNGGRVLGVCASEPLLPATLGRSTPRSTGSSSTGCTTGGTSAGPDVKREERPWTWPGSSAANPISRSSRTRSRRSRNTAWTAPWR